MKQADANARRDPRAAPIVLGRLFLRPGPGGTAANDLRLTLASTSTNYPVIEAGKHPGLM